MKYYLIAGEASGDLHASHLMRSLQAVDKQAEFRFFGGDLMAAVGGTLVKHYRELAYMGVVAVLLHLPTILRNMSLCKRDVLEWHPDVVILVDYPGFNLNIAQFLKAKTQIPVYYFIAPKIWAWKEYRIKNIRRDISQLFSILPFEVDFFEGKHHYPIHYVGNPTASEVAEFRRSYTETFEAFCQKNGLSVDKPIIALLAGSRKQEIDRNLPAMIRVAGEVADHQLVLAGAPGIDASFYQRFLSGTGVRIVESQTYALLSHAHVALVTSGTATLETALFRVPQVVCYATLVPWLIGWLRKKVLHVKYVSLVNLIANREVVRELVANEFTEANLRSELHALLDESVRRQMLASYDEVHRILGEQSAPDETARLIAQYLSKEK